MRRRLSLAACLVGGAALLAGSSAQASSVTLSSSLNIRDFVLEPVLPTTLLSLVDQPGQTGTPFELSFTGATGATTTTISIGGYQTFAYEYVSNISVTQKGGDNLLGGTWTLTRAASGSDANTQNDGTSVPALWFGGYAAGYYDTFSQTFATTPGDTYLMKFNFTNDSFAALSALFNSSNALLVTTDGRRASAVPEPATWVLMLLGCAGLGAAASLRRRKAEAPSW